MPDYLGADQRKTKEDEKDDKPIRALDEGDIALLKTYGQSTYSRQIKQVEDDIQQLLKKINELTGIKESDTGLAPPALWDLAADKQTLQSEQPLQVARYAHALWDFVFIPKHLEFGTNIVLKAVLCLQFITEHSTSILN